MVSLYQMPSVTLESAKFAKGLIFKIVEHALQEGWLTPGSTCLDPFGGVALGALPLTLHGVHYVGIALEERLCALGAANIALWRERPPEEAL